MATPPRGGGRDSGESSTGSSEGGSAPGGPRRGRRPARSTRGWPGVLELRLPGPPLLSLSTPPSGVLLWLRRGVSNPPRLRALRGGLEAAGALPPRTRARQAEGLGGPPFFFFLLLLFFFSFSFRPCCLFFFSFVADPIRLFFFVVVSLIVVAVPTRGALGP